MNRAYLIKLAAMVRAIGQEYADDFGVELAAMADDISKTAFLPEDLMFAKVAAEAIDYSCLKKTSSVPEFWRKNYDYGEVWPKVLDDYRSGKVKTIVDFVHKKRKAQGKGRKRTKSASEDSVINSYCNSKKNLEYWEQLLSAEPSKSTSDFINYIMEVDCIEGKK